MNNNTPTFRRIIRTEKTGDTGFVETWLMSDGSTREVRRRCDFLDWNRKANEAIKRRNPSEK